MVETCSGFDLESFVDGECTAEDAAGIRRHLAECAVCAVSVDELETLDHLLRETMTAEVAPRDLRQRVLAQAENCLAPPSRAPLSVGRRGFVFAAFGALAASAVVFTVGPRLLAWRESRHQIVSTLISDFETFLFAERVLDFTASEVAGAVDWYGSKLDFQLPAFPVEPGGNRLIGGRLCWLFGRRLASLSFEGADGALALYVMSADGLALPENQAGLDVSVHRKGRFTNVVWRQGDLAIGLVGDGPSGRVEQVAQILLNSMG